MWIVIDMHHLNAYVVCELAQWIVNILVVESVHTNKKRSLVVKFYIESFLFILAQ